MRRFLIAWVVSSLFAFAACPSHGPVRWPSAPAGGKKSSHGVEARIERVRRALAKAASPCQVKTLRLRLAWLYLQSGRRRRDALRLFTSVGPGCPLADLGLGLMFESGGDDRAALAAYASLLDDLSRPGRCCGGSGGLIRSGRCSLARFAAGRLERLLSDTSMGISVGKLLALAKTIDCGWASHRLFGLARRLALRRGHGKAAGPVGAVESCPGKWAVSVGTGLGALDLFEKTRLVFGQASFVSSRGCVVSLTHPKGFSGLARAQTSLEVPQTMRVGLWVDADGHPFRVLLDGREVLGPGVRWSWPRTVAMTCIQLSKGKHRLVVETPVGTGRHGIALWLTDGRGRPARGVSFGGGNPPGKGARSEAMESARGARCPRSWPGPVHLHEDLGLVAAMLGAVDASLTGIRDRAEALAQRLSASRFVEGIWLTAGLKFMPAGLSSDEVRSRALSRLRRALMIDPWAMGVARAYLDMSLALGKTDEVLGPTKRTKSWRGTWWWLAAKVRILLDRFWPEMARTVIEKIVHMRPDGMETWRLAWEVAWQLGDVALQRKAALRLRELDASDDHWARFLLKRGKVMDATKEYERLVALGGGERRDLEGLARAFVAAGRLRPASDILSRLVSREQWNASLWLDLANALLGLGSRQRAEAVLRRGMQVRPDSRDVRRALSALSGRLGLERLHQDALAAIAKYEKSRADRKFGPGPVFVVDHVVDWVEPGGGILELVHQVVHLRRGSDLGVWGQVPIPSGAQVFHLRVIKKDGRILVPERAATGPVHLPGVEVGDYAEIEYVVGRRPLGPLSGGFVGPRVYFATPRAATLGSLYQVVVPVGMELQIARRGHAPVARKRKLGDRILFSWQGPLSDQVRLEAHAPPMVLWLPSVRVAAKVTWARSIGASRRRFFSADRPSAEMRRLAAKFCRVGTVEQKARRIYDWVLDHVEQAGELTDPAAAVLARRRGYRLNLVRALLRLCRVDLSTVLVRPTHRAGPDGPIKDLGPYRYTALELHQGRGKTWYLFPFLKFIPFGFLPAMLRGAQAVRVEGPDPGPFRTPEDAGRDRVTISMDVQLGPTGRARMTVSEKLEGWPAVELRRGMEGASPLQFRQSFEKDRLAQVFPGAQSRGLRVKTRPGRRDLVVLRYQVDLANLARVEKGGRMTIRRDFFGLHLARRYVRGVARRSLPLQIGAFPEFELQVTLHGPKGWRLVSASQPRSLVSSLGAVHRSVVRRGNSVRLVISRTIPFRRVPAAEMSSLARFCRQADAIETVTITYLRRP